MIVKVGQQTIELYRHLLEQPDRRYQESDLTTDGTDAGEPHFQSPDVSIQKVLEHVATLTSTSHCMMSSE
jgi:hypothetical protein